MSLPATDIIRLAADAFGVEVAAMTGPRRDKHIAHPRQAAMYLVRELTSLSYPQIGGLFRRNHTTVLSGVGAVADRLAHGDGVLAARIARVRATVAALAPKPDGFDLLSLGDWLGLARRTGVPAVPARLVALGQVDDLRRAARTESTPDDPHLRERLFAFYRRVYRSERPGHMLRWDHCVPTDLKRMTDNGAQSEITLEGVIRCTDRRAIQLLDRRAPRDDIAVWARPWINARIVMGFPVEYRVYVRHGEVTGISNRHPPRALDYDDKTRWELRMVRLFAEAMIRAQALPIANPGFAERGFRPGATSAALDFICTRDDVLFLAGGLPHDGTDWGSVPCCFDGEPMGVALALPQAAEAAE